MRTTTPALPRANAPLFLLTLLIFAAGCDGSLVTTDAASTLDTPVSERGDVLYALAPLGDGDTFTATLLLEDGSDLTLVTEGIGDGLSRTHLDTGDLQIDSVTVEYLSDGVQTAPSRTIDRSGFFFKGDDGDKSEDPPASYHWEYINGEYTLVQDYTGTTPPPTSSEKQYLGTRGALFRLADGSKAPVTHLRYTLHGEPAPAPESVMFDTSVDFRLLQSSIR
ncbi:MAG: hypothetical protein AAGI52_08860 [Bacteroidota bacterium]